MPFPRKFCCFPPREARASPAIPLRSRSYATREYYRHRVVGVCRHRPVRELTQFVVWETGTHTGAPLRELLFRENQQSQMDGCTNKKYARPGSNWQPLAPEASALSNWATGAHSRLDWNYFPIDRIVVYCQNPPASAARTEIPADRTGIQHANIADYTVACPVAVAENNYLRRRTRIFEHSAHFPGQTDRRAPSVDKPNSMPLDLEKKPFGKLSADRYLVHIATDRVELPYRAELR